MAEPWYILESRRKDYLHNKTLYRRDYPCRAGEHEHCEFCFAKFGNAEGLLQSGYCTLDKYHWVCDECYRDFHAQFEWTVLDESHDSPSELR